MPEKKRKTAGVGGVSPMERWKNYSVWRKGFVENMSFKPAVEERMGNGW